jgi:hypothetical protein
MLASLTITNLRVTKTSANQDAFVQVIQSIMEVIAFGQWNVLANTTVPTLSHSNPGQVDVRYVHAGITVSLVSLNLVQLSEIVSHHYSKL